MSPLNSLSPLGPIIDSSTNLGDVVFERIGTAILDGTLEEGERLRDAELASSLGVSRTPVREALTRLARLGLVEVAASRYTRVTTPSPDLVAQTLAFTGYQAGLAVRMSIPRMSDEQIEQAVALLDQMIRASNAGDAISLYATSLTFYGYITPLTGNAVFGAMMKEAGIAMQRNLRGARPQLGTIRERADSYGALRDAFQMRDADAAEHHVRWQHGLIPDDMADLSELNAPPASN